MIPLTPQRIFMIARTRHRVILASSAIAALLSLVAGLMSPYIYRSEALVQFPAPAKVFEGLVTGDENMDILRGANVLRTPRVLFPVAESLASKKGTDFKLMVPYTISVFDLDQRLHILWEGLLGHAVPNENDEMTPAVLASLMGRHVAAEPDGSMRTIRITYEAGTPELAREVTSSILDRFIVVMGEIEQQEMKKQEAYLSGAIAQQLESIHETEEKMRTIVERYPHMSAGGGEQRGASMIAAKFVEQREMLRKIESELSANSRILTQVRSAVDRGSKSTRVEAETTSKIVDEISELEFRRLQYTKVSGYAEDHPEVTKLRDRIATLRKILAEQGASESASEDDPQRELLSGTALKTLYRQRGELGERARKLVTEKETLTRDLQAQEALFKEILKVSFDFDSLVRSLAVKTQVTSDLYREMQKVRIQMAGATGKASVLSPPSLSVHASNLSVRKRVFFGLCVGAVLGLSLLLLIDMLAPLLLSVADLALVPLEHVGPFRPGSRSFHRIASWLVSLRLRQVEPSRAMVVCMQRSQPRFDSHETVSQVAEALTRFGDRVGVLTLRDLDADGTPREAAENIQCEEILLDDMPRLYSDTIDRMCAKLDWVFVLLPEDKNGLPIAQLAAERSDCVLYLSDLGKTPLRSLMQAQRSIVGITGLRQFALVFADQAYAGLPAAIARLAAKWKLRL